MIPKIIHQTCRDPSALSAPLRASIERLKRLNPGWEHRMYSDDEVWRYLREHLDAPSLELARRLSPLYGAARADLFRYVLMYHEGGVYLDHKSTATLALDEVLRPDDAYLISQWRSRLGEEHPRWGQYGSLLQVPGGEFQQWHIVCEAGHAFLRAAIDAALGNILDYDPATFGVGYLGTRTVTGPICYTLAIHPILDAHPHRIVDIRALGFMHSIYRPYGLLDHHDDVPRDVPLVMPRKDAA